MKPRRVGYVLLVPVVVIAFYWKIVLVRQFSLLLGYEGTNQAYAWFNYWITSWRQGVVPIWDPFTSCGRPFAGEMQTGAFYPPYLMLLLAPFRNGMFSPQCYHYFYVASHIVCAWLMYALIRELNLGPFPGLVAGICFSLGGFNARLGEWPHLLGSAIWLPLIVILLVRSFKAHSTLRAVAWSALSGLALAMSILAGGLHVVIMQALVVVSLTIFVAAQARAESDAGRGKLWRRAILAVVVCLAFAVGGGAVQLFPSVEYSHRAVRFAGSAMVPAAERIPYAYLGDQLWPQSIAGLVLAGFPGNASSGEYVNPYLGVFPILLVVIGVARFWCTPWVRYMSGLALVAFLYSLGNFSLIHGLFYAVVPFLSMAREADRFMYLADFGLAVLAAYGTEALLSGAPEGWWQPFERAFRWCAVGCAFALLYPLVIGHGDINAWIAFSLLLVILSFALFRYIVRAPHSRWSKVLVLSLILFDLAAFDWSATNRIQASAKGADRLADLQRSRGLANFLRAQPGVFRIECKTDFAPNIGDGYGVETTTGSGVTMGTDYARIRSHPDLLNVQYVVKPASSQDPADVFHDAQWKVYANPAGYSRAWLVHEALVEPDANKTFQRLDDPSLNLRQVALVNAPIALGPALPASDAEQVSVHRVNNNHVELVVSAHGRALLVVSELFYPGWHASVNAKTTTIWKVDGGLRGIVVPAGVSHVEMDYAPISFQCGLALSIASFLGAGTLCMVARPRPSM